MKSCIRNLSVASLLATALIVVPGCGGGGGGGDAGAQTGTARATIVLTADDTARSPDFVSVRGVGGGPVPIEDIASLIVTVTEVTLQRCEGDGSADDVETVIVEDFAFDPTSVTVEEGGTVRWVWTNNTLHTITSGLIGDVDAGSEFDESADTAGAVIEIIFEDSGEYPYFSDTETDIEEAMTGSVNVVNDDGEGGEDGDGGHETVFAGAVDVEILDLTQLSEVLSSAIVPAGDYCRIIIRIANPRLVLVSDPNTVLTNVHLTANGRLFIQDHFELEDGEEVLILVNFGSIHLVEAGNSGRFVLTPQLRAEVDVLEAAVAIFGTIESIAEEPMIINVRTETDESFEVFVDPDTSITTDDDSDDIETRGEVPPTVMVLTFSDLAVGQEVEVEGLLTVGGQIDADAVEVADDSIDTTVPPAEA